MILFQGNNKHQSFLMMPSSLSFSWNFGSLLFGCLGILIASGVLLSTHYSPSSDSAFYSVSVVIMRDLSYGCFLRLLHSSTVNFFFLAMFLHISRGMYYSSFHKTKVWMSGVTIFFLVILIAFLGYSLVWGQMSFWAVSVITGLVTAVPYLGDFLLGYMWGGLTVSNPTVNRFFVLHFILPFVVLGIALLHVSLLHSSGSSEGIGTLSQYGKKMFFTKKYGAKDSLTFVLLVGSVWTMLCIFPYNLIDSENFLIANPDVTPEHIHPEWYFLLSYAVLRSVPNKLGGVICLVLSIAILYLLPMSGNKASVSMSNKMHVRGLYFSWVSLVFLLVWIGGNSAEDPFIVPGQIISFLYFLVFFFILLSS